MHHRHKKRYSYRKKLQKITRDLRFVKVDRHQREYVPFVDRIINTLLHWREIVKIGFLRWLIDYELSKVRKIRRDILRTYHKIEAVKAVFGLSFSLISIEWVAVSYTHLTLPTTERE